MGTALFIAPNEALVGYAHDAHVYAALNVICQNSCKEPLTFNRGGRGFKWTASDDSYPFQNYSRSDHSYHWYAHMVHHPAISNPRPFH